MYVIQCAFSRDRKIFLPWPRCLFRIISLVHLLSLSLSLSPPPSFPTKSAFHVAYRECRIFFNTCDRDNISDVFLFRLVFLPGTYLSPKIKKKGKNFKIASKTLLTGRGPSDSVYLFRASQELHRHETGQSGHRLRLTR